MSETAVVYPGKDLEAMSFAVKYHRWLLDELRPFIGKNIVEVGAGKGSFSEMLVGLDPDSLTVIEPSEMFADLKKNPTLNSNGTTVRFFNTIFERAVPDMVRGNKPDTIIYVNVLEHIEDDLLELKLINDSLADKGRCLIFVPAMPSLLSEFDRDIGHFRRYRKPQLEQAVRDAGFNVLMSKYFDLGGIVPWYLKYRVLGSRTMGGAAVSLYDNVCVPVARRIERLITPPIGKNIILAAEKKS